MTYPQGEPRDENGPCVVQGRHPARLDPSGHRIVKWKMPCQPQIAGPCNSLEKSPTPESDEVRPARHGAIDAQDFVQAFPLESSMDRAQGGSTLQVQNFFRWGLVLAVKRSLEHFKRKKGRRTQIQKWIVASRRPR
jgi:hypothetical protein